MALAPRAARARERPQRVKRVVGDGARPHEIPERIDGLRGIAAADRLVKWREERRAVRAQEVHNRALAIGQVRLKADIAIVALPLRRDTKSVMVRLTANNTGVLVRLGIASLGSRRVRLQPNAGCERADVRWQQTSQMIREVQGDASVALAERLD